MPRTKITNINHFLLPNSHNKDTILKQPSNEELTRNFYIFSDVIFSYSALEKQETYPFAQCSQHTSQ